MYKFFILILIFISGFVNSFTFDELTKSEKQALLIDDVYTQEIQQLSVLLLTGIEYAQAQTQASEIVQERLFHFFDNEDYTNEQFWSDIDPLKENALILADDFESKVINVNPRSNSQNPNAVEIYAFTIELLNEIADYLRRDARLNLNIIRQIEIEDFVRYDYLNGRLLINSAEFLKLINKYSKLSMTLLGDDNPQSIVMEIDIIHNSINASYSIVNGRYVMGEATSELITTEFINARNLNNQVPVKVKKAKERLEKLKAQVYKEAKAFPELDDLLPLFNKVISSASIYMDSSLRSSDDLQKGLSFFYENRYKLNADEDLTSSAEFNYLLKKMQFNKEQSVKFASQYNETIIEFTQLFLPIYREIIK